jgi:ankyrin repeat protein
MKIINTIYSALFNMSFAALYCFYYAIPLTILTISIIALSSIILAFIEYKSHLYYIDNMGHLYNCIEENNTKELLDLIEYGANVNAANDEGDTPLHRAAQYGHTQTAIALIERGADVNATDYDEATPLHLAVQYGHTEIAIALMDRGADVHAKNKRSWTPLHLAAQYGNKEIAIALIEHGADINAANIYGETPLHRAAIKGHTQTAIALMDRGADVHAKDERSWTPLHLAAQCGNKEIAIALIEHEANVNPTGCNGNSPLHLAIWNRQTEIAIALMDRGADVHAKDERNWTPLHLAAFHRHVEIAISLIERGADIHATVLGSYNMYYRTPLHIIIESHAAGFRNIEIPTIAMALIEHGANLPEDRSKLISIMEYLDWWTPLHTAVISNNLNEIRTLEYTPSETSPLDLAVMIGNIDAVRALIERGIQYDKDKCLRPAIYSNRRAMALIEYGANLPEDRSHIILTLEIFDWWTPLHTAIINNNLNEISTLEYTPLETSPLDLAVMIGNIDAVRALIERGIEYDKDKCLRTATYSNHHELAQLFLEKGANPLSKNKPGQTAFHFAATRGNASIMKIFVDNIRKNAARAMAHIEYGANLPEDRSNIILTLEIFDWWTPLHTAIINNNLDEISTLEYTPSETSPLDLAIMIGNIDAVRALIERGIQYDKDKCLRTATYSNRHELAQLFLEKGANPLSKNQLGQTAFHFADARGNENIMKIFVDNIRKKDNAAISIQRGFRSGLFKKDKANPTQEPTPPPSLGGPTP